MDAAVRQRQVIPLVDEDALLGPDSQRVGHRGIAEFSRVVHCFFVSRFAWIENGILRIAATELATAWVPTSDTTIGINKGHVAKTIALEINLDFWHRAAARRAGRR